MVGEAAPRLQPGGSAWYGAQTAHWLGAEVQVVTRVAPEDEETLTRGLRDLGIRINVYESSRTTSFTNRYDPGNPDARYQRVGSVARRFEVDDVPAGSDAYVFGPLTRCDMSPGLLETSGSAFAALDLQGILRTEQSGRVTLSRNPATAEFVQKSSVVKASRGEAVVASGTRTLRNAIDWFIKSGATEVLITLGSEGSIIATQNIFVRIPAFGVNEVVDTTGCGDIALAAYVVLRVEGAPPAAAALAASAAAAIGTSRFGVPCITRQSIEALVRAGASADLPARRGQFSEDNKHTA